VRLCRTLAYAACTRRLWAVVGLLSPPITGPTPWLAAWRPSPPGHPPLPPHRYTIKGDTPVTTAPFFFLFFPFHARRERTTLTPCPLVHPAAGEQSAQPKSEPPLPSSPFLGGLPSSVTLITDWPPPHFTRTFPVLQVHPEAACRHQSPPPIAAFASSCRLTTSVRTPPPHLVRWTPHASPVPPPPPPLHLVIQLTVSRCANSERAGQAGTPLGWANRLRP
jgi:hypothetical protein